jgi:hypothetical protein
MPWAKRSIEANIHFGPVVEGIYLVEWTILTLRRGQSPSCLAGRERVQALRGQRFGASAGARERS